MGRDMNGPTTSINGSVLGPIELSPKLSSIFLVPAKSTWSPEGRRSARCCGSKCAMVFCSAEISGTQKMGCGTRSLKKKRGIPLKEMSKTVSNPWCSPKKLRLTRCYTHEMGFSRMPMKNLQLVLRFPEVSYGNWTVCTFDLPSMCCAEPDPVDEQMKQLMLEEIFSSVAIKAPCYPWSWHLSLLSF